MAILPYIGTNPTILSVVYEECERIVFDDIPELWERCIDPFMGHMDTKPSLRQRTTLRYSTDDRMG